MRKRMRKKDSSGLYVLFDKWNDVQGRANKGKEEANREAT